MSTESKHLSGPENATKNDGKAKEEPGLKGTFVSVMLLGAFLIVTWVAVFILFISRQ